MPLETINTYYLQYRKAKTEGTKKKKKKKDVIIGQRPQYYLLSQLKEPNNKYRITTLRASLWENE